MAATIALLAAAPAEAAHVDFMGPNYTFPDGERGFQFFTRGGVVDPGVIVGFNPQPEPPGFPAAHLVLGDGSVRTVSIGPSANNNYGLLIGLLDVAGPAVALPAAPGRDGVTGADFTTGAGADAHHYHLAFQISGPGEVADWAAFNPQPEPPGDVLGVQFGFAAIGDPQVRFSLSEDGQPLTLGVAGVPEPTAWALMLVGLACLGAAVRTSRRAAQSSVRT